MVSLILPWCFRSCCPCSKARHHVKSSETLGQPILILPFERKTAIHTIGGPALVITINEMNNADLAATLLSQLKERIADDGHSIESLESLHQRFQISANTNSWMENHKRASKWMLAQIDATSVDVSVVNALVMLALTSSIPLWIRLWKKSVLIFFQNLSIGLSCGENGGRKIREMFTGISSFPVVCHPARSRSMTTYLPAFCAENFFNQLYIVQFGRCRLPNWTLYNWRIWNR